MNGVSLSVFLPIYNEEDNLRPLHERLTEVLDRLGRPYEILYIDDGSTDSSYRVLSDLAAADPRMRVIRFRKNFGQTAAMAAGIAFARGEILIPMDGDRQNDPEDIPKLLDKLEEGYDVVSGWRKERRDPFLGRRLPSMIANRLISWVSGVPLHDYGCSLKAYRREVLKDVRLYGEMHRFIPIYASWVGAKVAEIPVTHHPRQFGQSKYGLSRTFKVLLDLITVVFLGHYATKPIYIFGTAGLVCLLGATAAGTASIIDKVVYGVHFIRQPLPLLTVMLLVLGVQFILMGLLAEIGVRTYHESQDKAIYVIKETIN